MTPEIAQDAWMDGFKAGREEGYAEGYDKGSYDAWDTQDDECRRGDCDGYALGHRDGWVEGFDATGALTPDGLRRAGVSHLEDFVVRWDAAARAFVVTQAGREFTFAAPSDAPRL